MKTFLFYSRLSNVSVARSILDKISFWEVTNLGFPLFGKHIIMTTKGPGSETNILKWILAVTMELAVTGA